MRLDPQLAEFARGAPFPVCVWREAESGFELVELSDAAAELAGRDRKELFGASPDLFGLDAARTQRDLTRVAHRDESVQREFAGVGSNGQPLRLAVSFTKVAPGTVLAEYHEAAPAPLELSGGRVASQRYRALVAAANNGVWLVDADGSTAFANGKTAQMLGHPIVEILSGNLLDFVADEDRATVAGALECPRDTPEAFEARFRRDDGSELLCLLSVSTFAHEGPHPATLCVLSDLSALKQERELRDASERRFRRMVETANEGVWIGDELGRTTFMNQKLGSMLRVQPDAIIGQPFTKVVLDEEAKAMLKQAISCDGRPVTAELQLTRRDGSTLRVIASVSVLFDDQGKQTGSFAMITDVTRLRQEHEELLEGRERFAQVFEESPVGMVFIAAGRLNRGSLIGANRAFRDMVGRSDEELRGHDLWSITHPDDAAVERGLAHELFEGSGAMYDVEKRYVRADGSVLWARFRATVLRDSNGAPLYGLGVAVDITAEKEASRTASEAAEMARAWEARHARLVETVATPIALIGIGGGVIDVNPAFCALTGRPAVEMIGHQVSTVLPAPDDARGPWEADPDRAGRAIGPWRIESPGRGTQAVEVMASIVRDSDGAPVHWVCQFIPQQHVVRPTGAGELPPREPLSYRERQVLGLLARGLDGPAIAERLGLAAETVRSYAQSAREKLGADTRTHAVALALAYGEISL